MGKVGMTIEQMNARFGAPGRIVFHDGFAGYPNVVLANKYGSAEVALLGANVLSYRPTGHSPVIFRPAKRDYNRGDAFHGGIPVCWPQFGNRFSKDLPQHGFARKLVFDVRGTSYSEDMTEVTLGIRSNEETLKIWPFAFDLEYVVSVSMKLNLKLITRNEGKVPFAFSAGLHPYFAVRARDAVTVRGLDGVDFVDGHDMSTGRQTGDFKIDFAPDHIFSLPPQLKHELAILDPGLKRAIALVSSGVSRAVIWNCGPDGEPADFTKGDWSRYVCVEPVTDWPGGRELKPGERHELTAAIQATLESVPT